MGNSKGKNTTQGVSKIRITDEEIESTKLVTYTIYPGPDYAPNVDEFNHVLGIIKSTMSFDEEIRVTMKDYCAELIYATTRSPESLTSGIEKRLENLGFCCHINVYGFKRDERDYA